MLLTELWRDYLPDHQGASPTNAATIAPASWGNVATWNTGNSNGRKLVTQAGIAPSESLMGRAFKWRIRLYDSTAATYTTLRQYCVPSGGEAVDPFVSYLMDPTGDVLQILVDFYNTSSTYTIPIGAVFAWIKGSRQTTG